MNAIVGTGVRMSARHIMLAVFAAFLYASCYAAIKIGLVYAPPVHFAAWRAGVASTVLLAALGTTGRPLFPKRRLWLPTVLLALVGTVVGLSAMFASPRHTGVGLASVIGNTGPLLIIIFAALFLHEAMTRGKLVALVCGLAGVTLIALPTASSSLRAIDPTALLLPLLAAASGTAESVIVKLARPGPGPDVLRVAAWQYFLGSLVLFLLATWLEPGESITWTRSFVLLLALLGGGTTAAATAIWYWVIQREEVSRLSLVLFLVPVAGVALGIVLFDERITAIQGIGIVVVLIGVAVATLIRGPLLLSLRAARPFREGNVTTAEQWRGSGAIQAAFRQRAYPDDPKRDRSSVRDSAPSKQDP